MRPIRELIVYALLSVLGLGMLYGLKKAGFTDDDIIFYLTAID